MIEKILSIVLFIELLGLLVWICYLLYKETKELFK